jgi:hypothetical protein
MSPTFFSSLFEDTTTCFTMPTPKLNHHLTALLIANINHQLGKLAKAGFPAAGLLTDESIDGKLIDFYGTRVRRNDECAARSRVI